MSTPKFPQCPPQLKPVQHYLKLAADYDIRQPVISYWARLYALQSALKIDRKSNEAKSLLVSLMDWLEGYKKTNTTNESITSDVAGQAVVENEAHKLFTKADAEDRAGIFNKNVVKIFYTAGVLFDVIEVFGELDEEIAAQRKYAKWKATYIHNCLKNGETPVAGPVGENDPGTFDFDMEKRDPDPENVPEESSLTTAVVKEEETPLPQPSPAATSHLSPDCFSRCQKYCKYAISSLDYEDTPTAIDYLTKALNLLHFGRES